MASRRILKDTATVFVPKGENEDGEMQYDSYLLQRVFCRASTGKRKSEGGYAPNESIDLYIFDRGSYIEGETNKDIAGTCEAIFMVERGDGYQPSADNGEPIYVAPYDATGQAKPPSKSRRVSKVYRRKAGTQQMWHWEVHAI